ncbi:Uncharacterized protein APZ42_016830 [Daphnia magna]|uniref:Uncharacterized protein n=1 Tax=Daphnia magna TaxID=35525 RepID=A0A165A6F1_9CRUS|nr:Uncharacterized protein APZ42_016830 [Daphnia magna]
MCYSKGGKKKKSNLGQHPSLPPSTRLQLKTGDG